MRKVTLLILMLAFSVSAQAELYKWTDKSGGVHYSDQPPPGDVRSIERKKIGGNVIEGQDNFALKEASRKFPATLYVSDCGDPCNKARAVLSKRGIPFTQKNPETSAEDSVALKKLVGGLEVPTLILGQTTPLKGFEESSWNASLDAAGYPQTNPKAPSVEKAASEKAVAEKATQDKIAQENAAAEKAKAEQDKKPAREKSGAN
ncbi:MAG: glutaredoxin family protein [Burkholderiales bacterium]